MGGYAVRSFAFARTLVVASAFVWFFGWFVPLRWVDPHALLTTATPQRLVGLTLVVAGGLIAAACALTFPIQGDGTPAPFDPPRRLVTGVFYRWSRNPMYIGFFLFMFGEALLYRSWRIGGLLLVYIVAANLFVRLYEEPVLRRKFGASYQEYCHRVRRWL